MASGSNESPKPFLPHYQWMAFCDVPIPEIQSPETHFTLVALMQVLATGMRLGVVRKVIH